MKNRAKCKLCNSIIESFHRYDHVSCKCGEISIDGGNEQLICLAKDFKNFLRVDDDGNEIIVTVKDPLSVDEIPTRPTKKDLMDELERLIESIEKMPDGAKFHPINHYDFCSSLVLISLILRSD